MLLNVGEVLCGEMRLPVYVIGTPCAVNGWTCASSLARLSRVRRGRSARSVGSLSLGMLASYHTIPLLSTTNLRNAENSIFGLSNVRATALRAHPVSPHPPACPAVARSAVRRLASCHLLRKHDTGGRLHPDRRAVDQHRCCHYISISQLISTTHKRTGKHA